MKYFQNYSWCICISIILTFTCCTKSKSHLLVFFDALKVQINNESLLNDIRSFPQDSLYFFEPIFHNEFHLLLSKMENEIKLNSLVDSNFLEPNSLISREELFLFAFQKYLRKENINLNKVKKEIELKNSRYVKKLNQELNFNKNRIKDFIIKNDKRWKYGDTIRVNFPIESIDGYNFMYLKNYSDTKDSLSIKGVLIDKYYDTSNPKNESDKIMELVFRIKILELFPTNVYGFGGDLMVGDDFNVPLKHYDRLIEYSE